MIFDFDENEKVNNLGLFNIKYDYIIGTDEAGRGPGAGPLYAAAVCFYDNLNLAEIMPLLNDSKKLSEKTREELYDVIIKNSYFSIQSCPVCFIEEKNILNASLYAMKLAAEDVLSKLKSDNVLVLADGNRKIKNLKMNQKTVIKGDSKSPSIAAASILAKVSRDRFMIEADKKYPLYNFKKNKGYLTKEHIEALKKYGISDIHRKSFLKNILNMV